MARPPSRFSASLFRWSFQVDVPLLIRVQISNENLTGLQERVSTAGLAWASLRLHLAKKDIGSSRDYWAVLKGTPGIEVQRTRKEDGVWSRSFRMKATPDLFISI